MTPKLALLRAAQLLANDATEIKQSHSVDGRWHITDPADEAAKADHDERMLLSAQLLVLGRAQ